MLVRPKVPLSVSRLITPCPSQLTVVFSPLSRPLICAWFANWSLSCEARGTGVAKGEGAVLIIYYPRILPALFPAANLIVMTIIAGISLGSEQSCLRCVWKTRRRSLRPFHIRLCFRGTGFRLFSFFFPDHLPTLNILRPRSVSARLAWRPVAVREWQMRLAHPPLLSPAPPLQSSVFAFRNLAASLAGT